MWRSTAVAVKRISPPINARQVWATVDVCAPIDQPHTIGVRGSMPGDGHRKDALYMRFQVQYQDAATKRWVSLGRGADSGFLRVGSGDVARQAGRSFVLVPVAGKPAFLLRGAVTFQWRRAGTVLLEATRTTSAGHKSLAGADPKGFSAATCKLT